MAENEDYDEEVHEDNQKERAEFVSLIERRDEMAKALGDAKFKSYLHCMKRWFRELPGDRYLTCATRLVPIGYAELHWAFVEALTSCCGVRVWRVTRHRSKLLPSVQRWLEKVSGTCSSKKRHSGLAENTSPPADERRRQSGRRKLVDVEPLTVTDDRRLYGTVLIGAWMNGIDFVELSAIDLLSDAIAVFIKNVCFEALKLRVPSEYKGGVPRLLPCKREDVGAFGVVASGQEAVSSCSVGPSESKEGGCDAATMVDVSGCVRISCDDLFDVFRVGTDLVLPYAMKQRFLERLLISQKKEDHLSSPSMN